MEDHSQGGREKRGRRYCGVGVALGMDGIYNLD
jgi:hypothetical protein